MIGEEFFIPSPTNPWPMRMLGAGRRVIIISVNVVSLSPVIVLLVVWHVIGPLISGLEAGSLNRTVMSGFAPP